MPLGDLSPPSSSTAMAAYLYRGVNPELYQASGGKLIPKAIGVPFRQWTKWGDGGRWGDGRVWGESEVNAVIMHQRDSSANPTSGVSTTPNLEHAKRYATHDGKHPSGYVYRIDSDLLAGHGVRQFRVADYARPPAIPEDEEVVLVAKNFGPLPNETIVEIIEVKSPESRKLPECEKCVDSARGPSGRAEYRDHLAMTFRDFRTTALNEACRTGQSAKDLAGHADERTTERHYLDEPLKMKPLR